MEKIKNGVVGFVKRFQYNAPVILTFTLISFGVLLLSSATGGASTKYVFSVYRSGAADPLTYLRLFGHVLGHADFNHFFGNIMIILVAGPMLEEKYGSKRLAVMIAATALVTGIVHIAFSGAALLGASGVVFMLILLSSYSNLRQGKIPMTLVFCALIFIGKEIADALVDARPGTSQLSHIAGGLCGAGFGFIINRDKVRTTSSESEKEGD